MKNTKKFFCLILALVMVLAMTVPASATQEGPLAGGSITIENAAPGHTYNAYQILYLESYNQPTPTVEGGELPEGQYAYKANSAWEQWLKDSAADYLEFNEQGYVTWKTDADVTAFAELAQTYAATLTADATATAAANATTVTMSSLKLGYYLVDTSLGSLCSLDTTNPDVTMEEKNDAPTIEKQVQEDSLIPAAGEEDTSWGESNTAQIGDTVNFKTVVHAKKGAQGYVVCDKMSEGLTLQGEITVAGATQGTDYTVQKNVTHYVKDADGNDTTEVAYVCAFEITFTQAYLDTITENTDITITYSALLNGNAVNGTAESTDEAMLSYGDEGATAWAKTTTLTHEFDLVKTNNSNKVITGAEFTLWSAETGGTQFKLVKISDGLYRLATAAEAGTAVDVIEAGQATIQGLDLDAVTTYWLEEAKQPNGYNKLSGRVAVKAAEGATLKATVTDGTWTAGGIQVINQTGTELPSTGGIGTTVFYIVGGILLVGAGVLLVVRKIMSKEKESDN